MKTKKSVVMYRVVGRERDQLEEIKREIMGLQGRLLGLVQFIATREQLTTDKVVFNVDTMTFDPKPNGGPLA